MSIESAQAFLERMKTDEAFAKNVTECKDSEARIAYVKEAGFEFSLEEVKDVTSELTDDILDAVAGGGDLWGITGLVMQAKTCGLKTSRR